MARVIDGDAVKRRTWDIAEAWKDQGRNYEALLLESVIEQIVDTQPTLTPPNEPLTPCDVCQFSPPSSGDGKPCCMCPAERRPPEGEEARAEKAERERDAAISDLTYIARTYPVDLCDDLVCQYCKHYPNVNTGCPGWTENDCFEWSGQKED